ncbi:gamma-aminobutyric acid receptor subunit beta-like [Pieris napi]|uniref:gamma-aminobutyric acid receptor subunit beta-like n=1 Tax=Pieris napi TaxID=78633 RepID=UPI001FBADD9E|nr:gamma-aminobutyric acid receptor subunit beta-like [Pieris napi]
MQRRWQADKITSPPRNLRFLAVVFSLAIAWLAHPDQAAGAGGGGAYDDVSAILDSLTVSYDKRVRPNYGGPPVEVGVTMNVLSISSISEVNMDFTLDLYFLQYWTDPRLAYKKRPGIETLTVGSEFIRNIWVPDTFFVNEKQSYFHDVTTRNEYMRIHHSGSITRANRLTITASCPMDLQYFPMDRQLCKIEIESFSHTVQDIRYKWNEGPNSVDISSEVKSLPQFKVLGHRQRAMEISRTTGNHSRLLCDFQFERSMGYYIIQIYISSGIIVIISWISFWLNGDAIHARIYLGVTTVLTMTTLMSSTNAALPKVSYIKSIDVYLEFCFGMVFTSLLEFAAVGYMTKRMEMKKQQSTAIQQMVAETKIYIDEPPGTSEPLPPPSTARPSRSSELSFEVHENTIYAARAPSPPAPAPSPPTEEEIPPHLLQESKVS